jgi:hypothetical protein
MHLHGGEAVADQLVHHHEAQHVLLNATTAWGAALMVAAEIPSWRTLFDWLLDRCRITHESFATYQSCGVISVGVGSPTQVLAAHPEYAALVERLERYVAGIAGEHRRALVVSALARVCMQTPVLARMIEAWPDAIPMRSLRRLDLPDERLTELLRDPGVLHDAVVAAADDVVTRTFGTAALDADAAGGWGALDDSFDTAWELWEETVFAGLAGHLSTDSTTVLGSNGHLSTASQLARLAARADPPVVLRIEHDPATSDRRTVGLILRHARLWLSTIRRPARMVTLRAQIDLDELLRVADATTRIAGRPNLVLSARMPERLLASYEFPDDDGDALAELRGPVVAVRTIADDDTDTGTDAVWIVRLPEPADATDLAAAWTDIGDLPCCVAASCLADDEWRTSWLPVLDKLGPAVWLIDVTVAALASEFGADRIVWGLYLDLGPSATGARRAVAFKVEGVVGVWLAVADEVGIQMVTDQVSELPGIDLRLTGGDWSALVPVIRLVLLDLLHTESFVDLRAFAVGRR